jgi:drug/metabolite transporter (DMT)-like permease
VLATAAALGTLGPVAGLAYREGVDPAAFSALRAGVGATVLGTLILARRLPAVGLGVLSRRQAALLLLAVAVNGLMNLVLFAAFGAMAVGIVMAVFFTYPVQVAVMSAALGREPLTRGRVVALVLACAGLALVLGSQLGPEAHATVAGLALAALASTCHAVYLVAIRGGFDRVPAGQVTTLVLAGGLVISGIPALLLAGEGAGEWLSSAPAWAAILCAGTLGAALPKVWVVGGVRLIGSTRAAIAMLLEPVVAVGVSAVVLSQLLTPGELAGGLAILVAVIVAQRPAPRRSALTAAADPA